MKRSTITGILIASGLLAALPLAAQNPNQDAKIKIKENKVKIKGKDAVEAARDMLAPEVSSAFVEGYTVPAEYHTHFTALPPIETDDVVIRYRDGRVYYIEQDSWKIVRVVTMNPAVQAEAESAFVEGYVIPEAQRTTLVELPRPETNLTVRYHNDTAYYMDPEYRIVRTIRLGR